jgi:hypothetical protein
MGPLSIPLSSFSLAAMEEAMTEFHFDIEDVEDRVCIDGNDLIGPIASLAELLRYVQLTDQNRFEIHRLRRFLIEAAADFALPEVSEAVIEQLSSPEWNQRPFRAPFESKVLYGDFGPKPGPNGFLNF